jgi:hypothetical protein
MTVFACKDAFMGLGLEQVKPSASLLHQDCSICTRPLAVHHNHASPQATIRGYHTAVRIIACGHCHGQECLDAWLNVGNSCPTCSRILFELTGDPITQQDVNDLVTKLGREFGEGRVIAAVAGLIERQKAEHAALRRYHEQELARQKASDAKKEEDLYALSDEDLLNSDEELDFGGDDMAGDGEEENTKASTD